MVLSDHPLSPSGVGTQTRYFIEAMLKTGKYRFICLGGAVKHQNYTPIQVNPYPNDWVIYPVDGYGTQDMIRGMMIKHKPDILWFMTDPRFYGWLWEIENEVRDVVPMVYYHVWDNYPYPSFNNSWYRSNDAVATISKVTSDIVKTVCPEVEETYIPHMINTNIFKKQDENAVLKFKQEALKASDTSDKLLFFWNNRNARRKMSGSLIFWFKEYLDQVGHDKAFLLMHTDPVDPHGQDLVAILSELGLNQGQVLLSREKIPPEQLAMIYNMADCTLGISDAEGFGLSTFESLACETPIIVNMTGGLQEQVTDGKDWFGIGIEPASKAIIGSQEVPYIYEDRISENQFLDAMIKLYNMSDDERTALGSAGREWTQDRFNFEKYITTWDELFTKIVEEKGSWSDRTGHISYEVRTY